jgi:hypothetical protein
MSPNCPKRSEIGNFGSASDVRNHQGVCKTPDFGTCSDFAYPESERRVGGRCGPMVRSQSAPLGRAPIVVRARALAAIVSPLAAIETLVATLPLASKAPARCTETARDRHARQVSHAQSISCARTQRIWNPWGWILVSVAEPGAIIQLQARYPRTMSEML